MKTYEITYLTLKEEGHDAATIASTLGASSAKIVRVHPWTGRRKLVYPINKQDQAFYTTVVFEAETSAIKPIDAALRLNNDVLRHLIVEYTPGVFDRTPATEETKEVRKEETPAATETKEEVAPEAAPAEAKTEEEAPVTETAEAEAPATEESNEKAEEAAPADEKPKRGRAAKTEELDKKIDELLNEDITQ